MHLPFTSPVFYATVVKRYKRFFMDLTLQDGTNITAHCPNTGAMRDLVVEGRRAIVSYHPSPKRKLDYTLEAIEERGIFVGANTQRPNQLVFQGLREGFFPFQSCGEDIHKEVRLKHSRIDFALTSLTRPTTYIEVKNVHYQEENCALFPDCETVRGQKHLMELMALAANGHRCIMLYVIQRSDVTTFNFAFKYDPVYGALGEKARKNGVEMYAVTCDISASGISFLRCFEPFAHTV